MVDNAFFITVGIPENYPENTTLIQSTLPLDHTRHPLIDRLLQIHCHCTVDKSTKLKTS